MYKTISRNVSRWTVNNALNKAEKTNHDKPGENKRRKKVPEVIKRAKNSGELIKGSFLEKNKGGYRVHLRNYPAFCPHSEMYPANLSEEELAQLRKNEYDFKVLRIKDDSVIVSRKKAAHINGLHAAEKSFRQRTPLYGRVKAVKEYGAFIDINGIDGLLHISKAPNQKLPRIGQQIKVYVHNIDRSRARIALSCVAMTKNPR